MARLLSFAGIGVLVFSCLVIGIGAAPAQATIFDFTATYSNYESPVKSNFTLQYNDLNGNGVFSFNELVDGSFSGVDYTGWGFYTTLTGLPWYDAALSPLTEGGVDNRWTFTIPSVSVVMTPSANWTYSQTPSAVPIPPSALLLGSGLMGLGGWRRFRKS